MRRLVALLAAAAALAGCGLGEGDERSGGAELRITRGFGRELLASATLGRVREDQTVMRFLRSERDVDVRYGGRFVESIDGLRSSSAGGGSDWFYFVNGREASVGAAERELAPGDVVQWDYRRWAAAMRVPLIVGAYPEPFLHGFDGKRLPVRVECDEPAGEPCREAKRRLRAAGVAATGAEIGTSGGSELLRVIVAPWSGARQLNSLRLLEQGPGRSGVFARFRAGGRRLELLDEDGRVVRTAPAGTGLVAAVAPEGGAAAWVITGIDTAGVRAAARALDKRVLRDAFAVAVTPAGPERLPLAEDGS
jgi:hypothetical protein